MTASGRPHLRITCPDNVVGPATKIELITKHGAVIELNSVVEGVTWELSARGGGKATLTITDVEIAVGSNLQPTPVIEKLVRDRIPEIIETTGEKPIVRLAADSEMAGLLDAKLLEENEEFKASNGTTDPLDELIDIGEVLRTRGLRLGCGWTELTARMEEKRNRCGGFEEGIVWMGNE